MRRWCKFLLFLWERVMNGTKKAARSLRFETMEQRAMLAADLGLVSELANNVQNFDPVEAETQTTDNRHPDFLWNPRRIQTSPPDTANSEAEKRIPTFLRHRDRAIPSRIPVHTPEWSNPRPGDPGITSQSQLLSGDVP